ncbi:nuclear transport factor 2 family protein [Pseudorhodoplanes sp.]|uniref:nuclear transport factor 2 family protein n=1 Tax=Pseudorhodoplanes sp. TaxID=1934341 RepID=UPI002B53E271|nr:nuclear transport factor 2 family protein [Pseudorhodoplanes sp.]HWV54949.1 nuclear transport factor 2 family protein [Pseudorhodoplanes sp.]
MTTDVLSAIALPATLRGRDLPPFIGDFYRAYSQRDAGLLDAILDDDVEWLLNGPADQFDMYGHRRGKAEVIELVTRILPCFFRIIDFEIEHLLLQGERVAIYGRLRARQRDTGRSLCFRAVHFLRFRNGKLIAFHGLGDTFDAAQQVVGHPIDVHTRIDPVALVPEEDALLSL